MPEVIIASSFLRAQNEMSPADAQRINTFVLRLQRNPEHPGFGFEKLHAVHGTRLLSARINARLRAILHRENDRFFLLYVGQHDNAYDWAQRRYVGPHPATGAMQIVEVPETVEPLPPAHDEAPDENLNFGKHTPVYLCSLGVPDEWLERVRSIRDEKGFWDVYSHLPEDVGECLYGLALGEAVEPPAPIEPDAPVASDPHHSTRFHVLEDGENLQAILSMPFERWALFLHPVQRRIAEGTFNGPVKVTGPAGTGKTVVAIHHARHLARLRRRVLLTTYNRKLQRDIGKRLDLLCQDGALFGTEQRQLITVSTLHSAALSVCGHLHLNISPPGGQEAGIFEPVEQQLQGLQLGSRFTERFVRKEWDSVIAKQGVESLEEYRRVERIGRGEALGPNDRKKVWPVFESIYERFAAKKLATWGQIFKRAHEAIGQGHYDPPYDAAIVDEIQDLSSLELLVAKDLVKPPVQEFMLVGDAGQRIYPGGFSLRKLGIEVRGRSFRLDVNYRTTANIAHLAQKVRAEHIDNLEDGDESNQLCRNVFSGEDPELRGFPTIDEEKQYVVDSVSGCLVGDYEPCEIGVFAKTRKMVREFAHALRQAGIRCREVAAMDGNDVAGCIFCDTMHAAKGHEFRVVFVVACNHEILIPFEPRNDDLRREFYSEARNLLYVAMTRARERLFVTWFDPKASILPETT